MHFLAKGKSLDYASYSKDNLPKIAIVFAAYNEEKVIAAKMQNFNKIDYPTDRVEIHIGLDNPSDQTATIIEANKDLKFPVFVHHFKERGGKANVLNRLFQYSLKLSDFELVVLMDANIISEENTLFELVKFFKDERIGAVAARIKNDIKQANEIALQEQFYIQNEGQLKVNEGLVFGASAGAFGACYAIRSKYIKPIPGNYLMEDFYLSMHVLQEGAHLITNPKAFVHEDLPGTIKEEFKRKVRISSGNFQNLSTYKSILLKGPFRVAFPFFSHKVLRWISPLLILIMLATIIALNVLHPESVVNKTLLGFCLLNSLLPLLDVILQSVNINVNLLRIHRYFILMNVALFWGLIKWLKGIETNIWKPTERT